jgi:CheY-like chemotaxis protein
MSTLAERTLPLPHVLIIDDNRGDALLVQIAFQVTQLPADITILATAEEGMRALLCQGKYAALGRPDFIILDLNLPTMNGLSFLNWIKGEPGLASIPVIVLSSSAAEKDVNASYAGQAVGYFTKPYDLAGYESIVKGLGSYWFHEVHMPTPGKGLLH